MPIKQKKSQKISQRSTNGYHKTHFSALFVMAFYDNNFHSICAFKYTTCANNENNSSWKQMLQFALDVMLAPCTNLPRQTHDKPIVGQSSSFPYSVLLFTNNAYKHNKNQIVKNVLQEALSMKTSLLKNLRQLKRK